MDDIKIKNYMEDLVTDMMPSILGQLNVCQCERCHLDILAHVLNKLPPKYVVTKRGHLYTKIAAIQAQFEVDIIAAITKAAAIVSEKPRHED